MELLDFSPTREQLREYKAQSIFHSPKSKLSPEESGEILKNRAKKNNIEIDGQIEHFTNKGDRGQYTRTLSNTLNNPDIEFSSGNKGYVVKKYDTNGKPFFDFVTKKDGKLYNKFNTNAKYVDNQIKKTAENVSLNGRIQQPTDAGYIRPADEYNNIVSNQRVVVNKNMPRLSDYTKDLDQFQQESLAKAINKGATMSTSAKGSLGATHRAQEVLNDMIDNSYDTSVIGTKKATTETRELMEVKDRLNQILEPSGIKPYDKSLSKAKNLQVSFEKGYNFKPSNFKFDNMGLKTARDKQAFLQGRIQKLTDNVLSDGNTNLATAIKKDENTLRKLMPENKFQELMKKAGKIETEFERLKTLEGSANQRLRKQPVEGRSINRENFESRGALIGRAFDVLEGIIKGKSNARLANMYLNPNTTQITDFGGLRGAGQETYPYLFREVVNYLTNKNNSRNN